MLAWMATDTELLAEIGRHCRQRMMAVYLMFGFALLLSLGVFNSQRMMHPADMVPAEGVIVAVGKDANNGETTFTAKFTDAAGVRHTDTQSAGYHYAPGEPQVGQPIEYLYIDRPPNGFYAFPRADRILQLVFGVPMLLMVFCGALFLWLILRQRAWRRWLVRNGTRVQGEGYEIRERTVVIPGGSGGAVSVHTWRLQARRFDPAASEYVDVHGDWRQPPVPKIDAQTEFPPILVDPRKPARYWLPSINPIP
jgi:hypothetical protein